VSAGLESIALGETQILGQVTHAYEQSRSQHKVHDLLARVFQAAIHASKRAHAKTAIGRGMSSVSSLAIAKAVSVVGPLDGRHVTVIGTGNMAKLLIAGLSQYTISQIVILSRSQDRAAQVMGGFHMMTDGVEALPVDVLSHVLTQTDVVFAATNAVLPVVTHDHLVVAMQARENRPLYLVDVGMPRNIDNTPVKGAHLYDLDALQRMVEETRDERQKAIPAVEAILTQELNSLWAAYQGRAAAQTIQQIRQQAEHLRQAELDRVYRHLAPDAADTRELVSQFSYRFMNKVLHQLMVDLKANASWDGEFSSDDLA
jgi:glutamyl-tRNA reductase